MSELKNLFPEDAASLLKIADTIIDKHQSDGVDSPLNPGLIAKLSYKLKQAKLHHEESEKYKMLWKESIKKRNTILGLNKNDQNTEYFIIDYLKEIMTKKNGNNEEKKEVPGHGKDLLT